MEMENLLVSVQTKPIRLWLDYERIYSSTDGENWTLVHDPNY